MLSLTKPKAQPFARNHLLRDASWKAVHDAMRADPMIHVFGEGAQIKAHYDAPELLAAFPSHFHTMPIAEDGSVNFAVGTALMGYKPIIDVISCDFLFRAMDGIVNTAAKLEGRTIVIRAETLLGGPTTGQRPEAMFCHVPGLRVVCPSTPRDAYGLMAAALKTPVVTIFIEDREISDSGPWLTGDLVTGEVQSVLASSPNKRFLPMSSAAKLVPVVTVLAYGVMRPVVERAVAPWLLYWDGDYYAEPNYSIDLLDMPVLCPFDFDYLEHGRYGLKRTGKLLIVEPDVVYGGVGAEIAAWVAENMPEVKVKRLGAPKRAIPASPALHGGMLPSEEEILDAIASF